jgi:hypothetical protein
MKKCPSCDYNLNFIQLKCPICRNYVWRRGYTVAGTILTVIIGTCAIITIDYLAVNRVPGKPEQGVNLPAGQPPRRSNPNYPRPAHKRHF